MPDRSESINADSLNSNFLQLGRRSGGRPQRTVYPRRLPVNTVIHTYVSSHRTHHNLPIVSPTRYMQYRATDSPEIMLPRLWRQVIDLFEEISLLWIEWLSLVFWIKPSFLQLSSSFRQVDGRVGRYYHQHQKPYHRRHHHYHRIHYRWYLHHSLPLLTASTHRTHGCSADVVNEMSMRNICE